jgi:hypothetical protein
LDWFGRNWVLVVASGVAAQERAGMAAAFDAAFARRRIALSHAALPSTAHDHLFERKWVLVRPDGHVAWRGDGLAESADQITSVVTGNSSVVGRAR